jgi:predicted chitinase
MSYLKEAAQWYNAETHQAAAWDALEEQIPQSLVNEFQTAYRAAPAAPVAVGGLITTGVFEELTGYTASLFTQQEADDCNRLLRETGFDKDISATQMLMANMMHETCNFKYMKEIADGWAYEGRSDLGNIEPGDGPRYKGAGVLQLTGRYNYQRFSLGVVDARVMEGVDYVSTTYPFMSALTWIEENNLLHIAQTEGFEAVCRRINGGTNGLTDRFNKYEICKRVLV